MSRSIFWLVFIACLSLGSFSEADLIVLPMNGNILLSGDPFIEDITVTINGGSTFGGKFYGNSVGPISVAENGNLNFSNNGAFFPFGFTNTRSPDYIARIAPLWDDILLFQPFPNRVVDHSVPGSYLAVTWENVLLFNNSAINPPPVLSVQVLWFESQTSIRGFTFEADDIAFGYQDSVPGTDSFGNLFATVGITNGMGAFTALPGDQPEAAFPLGDGYITSNANQAGLLAWETDHFLLFRPNALASTGYTASKQRFSAPIPEPRSILLASLLIVWVGLTVRNRPIPS